MLRRSRPLLAAAVLTALAMTGTACSAAGSGGGDYSPGNRVRYLVGFKPGGGTDLAARTAAQTLAEDKIVPSRLTVENLDGAGGLRAFQTLARQGNDDTLMQQVDVAVPLYDPEVDLDLKDFKPVAQIATSPLIIVTAADSPYKNARDLFEDIQSSSDVTIGLPTTVDGYEASTWEEIAKAFGTTNKLQFVPSAGAAEVIPEVLSGRLDTAMLVPSTAASYLSSGKLKALAITSADTDPNFPDVQTLKAQGADVTLDRPQGVLMSAKASDSAVKFWSDALKKMTQSKDWETFTKKNGLTNEYENGEEYGKYLQTYGDKYAKYLKSLDR